MTYRELLGLVPNERVVWKDEEGQTFHATVTEVGYNTVKVRYDDGRVGIVDEEECCFLEAS